MQSTLALFSALLLQISLTQDSTHRADSDGWTPRWRAQSARSRSSMAMRRSQRSTTPSRCAAIASLRHPCLGHAWQPRAHQPPFSASAHRVVQCTSRCPRSACSAKYNAIGQKIGRQRRAPSRSQKHRMDRMDRLAPGPPGRSGQSAFFRARSRLAGISGQPLTQRAFWSLILSARQAGQTHIPFARFCCFLEKKQHYAVRALPDTRPCLRHG